MVGTGPGAEVANVLRVEADGLAAELVELVLAEDDLGGVNGGGEDAELGHLAHPHISLAHVLRPGDGGRRSVLGDDEVGAWREWETDEYGGQRVRYPRGHK